MNDKIKQITVCVIMAVLVFGFALLCLFLPKPEFLDSERREPAALPELSLDSIMKDGADYGDSFMKQFDDNYSPDNFPFRDMFRSIKGFVINYVFGHTDKDGVFMEDGYIAEMQDTLNQDSIDHAVDRFSFIYKNFLEKNGVKPYISIIPDKAYFLAEQNGYLSMDYDAFIEKMLEGMDFATYIDIVKELSIDDYYKTDTHWRQEQLTHIAATLVNGMGGRYDSVYQKNTLDHPFYGVYSGRVGRPVDPETIYYLTNDNMQNVKVYDHEKGKEISLYDMEKATGKDPYDMFLSGEISKVTIENPNAKTDKELVVFRDSYGRSLIPLLVDDYAKITVIDIRYQVSFLLCNGVSFENADVLFLYSTLVLNNSSELK